MKEDMNTDRQGRRVGRIQKAKRMNHIFYSLMKAQNVVEEGNGGGSRKGRFGSDCEYH